MNIDFMKIAQVASVGINLYTLGYLGLKRVSLNKFLVGKWEGSLVATNDPNFIIECTLFINSERNSYCSGNLVYKTKKNRFKIAEGVDKIIGYENPLYFPNRWTPKFQRVFHTMYDENITDREEETFDYDCRIDKRWFQSKMNVISWLNKEKVELRGTWYRK